MTLWMPGPKVSRNHYGLNPVTLNFSHLIIEGLLEDIPEWNKKHIELQKRTILYEKMIIGYSKLVALIYCPLVVIPGLWKTFYLDDSDAEWGLITRADL